MATFLPSVGKFTRFLFSITRFLFFHLEFLVFKELSAEKEVLKVPATGETEEVFEHFYITCQSRINRSIL